MSSEHNFPGYKDKSFDSEFESLSLSDKLKQKGLVQSITIDRKANTIKVILNHGSNAPIISTIYPKWARTLSNFEKQTKRKISSEDILQGQ